MILCEKRKWHFKSYKFNNLTLLNSNKKRLSVSRECGSVINKHIKNCWLIL